MQTGSSVFTLEKQQLQTPVDGDGPYTNRDKFVSLRHFTKNEEISYFSQFFVENPYSLLVGGLEADAGVVVNSRNKNVKNRFFIRLHK